MRERGRERVRERERERDGERECVYTKDKKLTSEEKKIGLFEEKVNSANGIV